MTNIQKPDIFKRRLRQVGAALLLTGSGLSAGAETLYISKIAAYRNPGNVQEAVRQECQMDARIPEMVRDEIIRRAGHEDILLEDDPLGARRPLALVVTIVGLDAPPGAGWNQDTKFLKIKAVVYRNGTNAGEFVRAKNLKGSRDPIMNALKNRNNCQMLDRMADDLSAHVAVWLKKQHLHAKPAEDANGAAPTQAQASPEQSQERNK